MLLDFSVFATNYIHTCICHSQAESASVDADIQKEFARQREHLERSVASLRKKLVKDSEIHRSDNVRIMQVSNWLFRPLGLSDCCVPE
jgi:hypothetical protein